MPHPVELSTAGAGHGVAGGEGRRRAEERAEEDEGGSAAQQHLALDYSVSSLPDHPPRPPSPWFCALYVFPFRGSSER